MIHKLNSNLYYDDNSGEFSCYPSREYMDSHKFNDVKRGTCRFSGKIRGIVDLLINKRGETVSSETIIQELELPSEQELYKRIGVVKQRVLEKLAVNESPIVNQHGNGYSIAYEYAVDPFTGEKLKSEDRLFTRIDETFIAQHKVSDRETISLAFHNQTPSASVIFEAIINALIVRGEEYEEICQRIFETAKNASALFLMANGGLAKSTILCEIALMAYRNGFHVCYFEDEKTAALPEITEETFILIDNAYDHQSVVESLYKKYNNNRNVHVIMADRIHKINSLLEAEIPVWATVGKGIALIRGEEPPVTRLRKTNMESITLSSSLIKSISDAVIDSLIKWEGLSSNADILAELDYTRKSITDIVQDFCILYNKAADDNENTLITKKHIWDWDIWDEIPALKGSFKYVAALYGCGARVTTMCFEKMTGHSDSLVAAVREGKLPIVSITDDGYIQFRHDTVADNYFNTTMVSPYNALKLLVNDEKMDDDTVIRFVEKVLSLSNIITLPVELSAYRIPDLLQAFHKSRHFRDVLSRHEKIHLLEFALIMQKSGNMQNKSRYFEQAIGASFCTITGAYDNKASIWTRYFNFACRASAKLPQELLEYLASAPKESAIYKKATDSVNNLLWSRLRWMKEDEKHIWLSNAEALFLWIIKHIAPDDVPSRINLARIYRSRNEFEKARRILIEISQIPQGLSDIKSAISLIHTYDEEVKMLVRKNRDDPMIRETNNYIRSRFKEVINHCEATDQFTTEYVSVIRNYVRFLMDTGYFDDAYEELEKTIKTFESDYENIPIESLYIELGML